MASEISGNTTWTCIGIDKRPKVRRKIMGGDILHASLKHFILDKEEADGTLIPEKWLLFTETMTDGQHK